MARFVPTPIVEVVDIEQDQVVLISKQPLPSGSANSVRAWLGMKGMETFQQLVDLKVAVQTARPTEAGTWACVGWLTEELPFEPVVVGADSAVLRRSQRRVCRFRVVSPDLPDFAGMSLDLSSTGMQIETRGKVRLGSVIQLRLEPDMSDWYAINFKARVAWHHMEGSRNHRLGLEFVDLSADSRRRLAELERFLDLTRRGSVVQSTLRCADKFLASHFN